LTIQNYREEVPAAYRKLWEESGDRPDVPALAQRLGISKETTEDYIRLIRAEGINWPPPTTTSA
jgi:hypothetical protein